MNESKPASRWRWLGVLATTIVCFAILAGAAAAIVVINRTEPTAKQINATRKSSALVDTLIVQRDRYTPRLSVLGTVLPARDITLSPRITGKPIENVVRLSRQYVRDRDTVWLMEDEKLTIRECTVLFRDADYAYINEGLESGDEVVLTTLATVAEGVGLKRIGEETVGDQP